MWGLKGRGPAGLVAAVAFLAGGGFAQQPGRCEAPKLVVMLQPVGEEFVPLDGSRKLPGTHETGSYSFLVMAVDQQDPLKTYVSAARVIRLGEKQSVTKTSHDIEVRGIANLSDSRVARYEAELLVAGRQVASAAALLTTAGQR